uniref:hypothetical protein n=2 Tax=Bifidobacterium pullorum TaxID=78448 RepID=UPI0019D327AB
PRRRTGRMGGNLPDASPYACSQWTVAGFNSPTQLKLRPLILSPEGLERVGWTTGAAVPEEVDKLIAGRGWVVAVNTLAAMNPVCLRFDALGDPRWKSRKHVPLSWDWDEKKQGR